MNNKIKELFRRYEMGEASESEKRLIEAWFKHHEQEPIELDKLDKRALKKLDIEVNKIFNRQFSIEQPWYRILRKNLLPYAAIFIAFVMICLVLFLINTSQNNEDLIYVTKTNESGKPLCFILPDSSEVYLGAAGSVRYPVTFDRKVRSVDLIGEAFFKVKRNVEKEFIVSSQGILTKVLGTSFKVEAFDKNNVKISVATGKVGIERRLKGREVSISTLAPGEELIWDGVNERSVLNKIDVYMLEQWQGGSLVFDDHELYEVFNILERRFGVKIIVTDDNLKKKKISTMFGDNETLDQVFGIISKIGKFTYTTSDGVNYHIYKIGG
ncbi:FecR family protein [Sphingobacterium sp. UT-1RO-CII-1]|uniref:FecR family protein n=1 Tax=Sphingobacterium sp. UT-1RO-CII-1 TaxID=2995225 RepID=UPI00227B10E9|nr:FecR family protein [Sphingobacterium sp. UT-1RO-CII-1]MCY4779153.1 FecR family protein [Sphingobacterium sp. UT-1RO-CII-1]